MASISAIVITLNEEKLLPNCLHTLAWADEVIVVDNGSTDKTIAIARQNKAIIVRQPEADFSQLRNQGAKVARSDWLFYVDADERVTPRLKKEILTTINQNPQPAAYQIPRYNYQLGKLMLHGGWYPDYQTRLIRQSALKSWQGKLHEFPLIAGYTGKLKQPLIHLTHRDLDQMLIKTRQYVTLEAELMLENNHPPVKVKHLFAAFLSEFFHRALRQSGWRDGLAGWLEVFYQAFNRLLIMMKLAELQQKPKLQEIYQQLDENLTQT